MSGVHLEQWSPWYLVSKELCRRSKELSQTVLQCSRHNTGNTRQQHWPHWYLVRYWAPVNNVIRPALKQWLCIFISSCVIKYFYVWTNDKYFYVAMIGMLVLNCCCSAAWGGYKPGVWFVSPIQIPPQQTAEQCVCIPVKITDSELFWIWQLQIWL